MSENINIIIIPLQRVPSMEVLFMDVLICQNSGTRNVGKTGEG